MEQLKFWRGKSVFLTGHTGFKGAWLTLLLKKLGAEVHGYALDPQGSLNVFDLVSVANSLAADHRADIRDLKNLAASMASARPDIVIHMAAQSLVLQGYREPLSTFGVNVMGTANVLEACRTVQCARAIVVVTTDKVYENRNWMHPYGESDKLGGHDPYSASKACAELVTAAYHAVFAQDTARIPNIATARAGNVTGGGDWAADRLIPDCVRAFNSGQPVTLRNPQSVRPWQHVLDPLQGYLRLAQYLFESPPGRLCDGWNFGPSLVESSSALAIATQVATHWGGGARVVCAQEEAAIRETHILRLDSSKARLVLGWRDCWTLEQNIEKTTAWYKSWRDGKELREVTDSQISGYLQAAR
jgi:CDP-glucose 4,6-dehydratase